MNIVFIDLDETLIHTLDSFFGDAKPHPDIPHETLVLDDGDTYVSSLRVGAMKLLERLRSKAEVYMLTTATRDYAIAWNKRFNLGFPEDRIYSREDIKKGFMVGPKNIPEGPTFLIDNLEEYDNHKKIRFISHVKKPFYIKIEDYYGHPNMNLKDQDIAELTKYIV